MDLRSFSGSVEIPIWVEGCQKWLTGLTKRTTCDDIIYALLSTERKEELDNAHTYAIFERWRDVERPLQGRTKILKVWKAWGIEQKNVKLQLQKFEDLHYSVEWVRTRKRHPRRSRSRSSSSRGSHCRCPHCSCQGKTSLHKPQSLESLVETVITQEDKIKSLYRRIHDTDRLIESYEARTHHHRLQQNGQNYVQDAYLESMSDESSDDLTSGLDPAALEQYLKVCDSIIHLEDRIMEEKEKVQNLSVTLNQEVDNLSDNVVNSRDNVHGMLRHGWKVNGSSPSIRDMQIEINTSMAQNLEHAIHLENLNKEIRFCNQEWQEKKAFLESLIGDLEMFQSSVDSYSWGFHDRIDNVASVQNYFPSQSQNNSTSYQSNPTTCRQENAQLLKQRGLIIDNSDYMPTKPDDNDSDTGLSSMHSDECPSTLETLV